MTKTLLVTFSAAIMLLAAAATMQSKPVVVKSTTLSQNPIPACPPFCDEPNGGGGQTAKR